MASTKAQGKASPRPAGSKELFDTAESAQLVDAIGAAERGNRGEVRVHLEARCSQKDPLERAREIFFKLGMERTRDDTGVLLYVAFEDRKAAVFAGSGIHGAAAKGFWQEVVDEIAAGFRDGEPLEGLRAALGSVGVLLREHAAGDDSAGDELPNQVTTS
jgi:uncharacterized membrane protein